MLLTLGVFFDMPLFGSTEKSKTMLNQKHTNKNDLAFYKKTLQNMLYKKNRTDCVTFGHVQLIPISGLKQKCDICKKFKKHKNWIYVTNG